MKVCSDTLPSPVAAVAAAGADPISHICEWMGWVGWRAEGRGVMEALSAGSPSLSTFVRSQDPAWMGLNEHDGTARRPPTPFPWNPPSTWQEGTLLALLPGIFDMYTCGSERIKTNDKSRERTTTQYQSLPLSFLFLLWWRTCIPCIAYQDR